MLHQIDFYKIISQGRFDKSFHYQTSCIVDMYWYRLFLTKTNFGIIKKINIYITDNDTIKNYSAAVKTININFDFYKYNNLDKHNKKKMILDTIHQTLLSIAQEEEIDVNKLNQAYQDCIDRNLEHKWILNNKLYKSPNKKYYGAVECNWEIDFLSTTAIIYNAKKIAMFRKELFKVTFDQKIGYPGYIYTQKPNWSEENKFIFELSQSYLKNLTPRKWEIDPDDL